MSISRMVGILSVHSGEAAAAIPRRATDGNELCANPMDCSGVIHRLGPQLPSDHPGC